MFLVIAFVVVGITILMAVGVFIYGRFLQGEADKKAAELQYAQQSVNEDTVEGFLRLKNRLMSATSILDKHIVLSEFFTVLENLTLKGVRFTALGITVTPDRGAEVKMSGVARDFNALAAQSAAFANDKRIKQAIFSGINVDESGVIFSLAAKLDSKLITLPPAEITATVTPEVPDIPTDLTGIVPEEVASTTPTATTTTP